MAIPTPACKAGGVKQWGKMPRGAMPPPPISNPKLPVFLNTGRKGFKDGMAKFITANTTKAYKKG